MKQTPGTVTHHSQLGGCHPVELTTCQVQIVSADGSTTKARALFMAGAIGAAVTAMAVPVLDKEQWQPLELIITNYICAYPTGPDSKPFSVYGRDRHLYNNYSCM